jgi:hypothetical protein
VREPCRHVVRDRILDERFGNGAARMDIMVFDAGASMHRAREARTLPRISVRCTVHVAVAVLQNHSSQGVRDLLFGG